jgi:putative transposase
MDWKTRAVISWKVSTTLESGFCVEALEEAVRRAGCVPEIFNTDQGSQFTGASWIEALQSLKIRISMDGKGRWMDNVFVERLWRAVKYEGVYLWGVENVHELERHLVRWFEDYNRRKPHSSLEKQTPWECYRPKDATPWRAAA